MLVDCIVKTDRVQIEKDVFVHAIDEEVNTVVQDVYGVDYVLVHDIGLPHQKYWRTHTLNAFSDEEVLHDSMLPLNCVLQARNDARNAVKQKTALLQTQPKPPVQQTEYIKFMSQQLKTINRTHPSLSNKEKMTMIAKLWQNVK